MKVQPLANCPCCGSVRASSWPSGVTTSDLPVIAKLIGGGSSQPLRRRPVSHKLFENYLKPRPARSAGRSAALARSKGSPRRAEAKTQILACGKACSSPPPSAVAEVIKTSTKSKLHINHAYRHTTHPQRPESEVITPWQKARSVGVCAVYLCVYL